MRKDTRLAGLQFALRIMRPERVGLAFDRERVDERIVAEIRAERKRKPKKGAAR